MTRTPKDYIVTALDVSSEERANALAKEIGPHVGVLKLGLEFFTAFGPAAVRTFAQNARVFLDAKLHDIPNTMGKSAANCAATGAAFINVHASAGRKAIEAAVASRGDSAVLAVTVLTSLEFADLVELGLAESYSMVDPEGIAPKERAHMQKLVLRMALLAFQCGAQGVICSPEEIEMLRQHLPPDFIIMTPGVRPSWYGAQDQKRVMTPREAIAAGADYLVVGRPITNPPEGMTSLDAIGRIVDEIRQGIADRVAVLTMSYLEETGAVVRNGHFRYTSGKHGSDYVKKDKLVPHVRKMTELVGLLCDRFDARAFDVIVGPAVAAIPIARDFAHVLNARDPDGPEVRSVFTEKVDGIQALKREFAAFVCGKRVLVVEDILTTGASARQVVDAVREVGGTVVAVAALVNRGGLTNETLAAPRLEALLNISFPAYDEADCPHCKDNIAFNTEVGHATA